METIRAFVALNLPVATVNRLAETQRTLRRAAKEAKVRVGWVPASNMHITLKFLGEIDAENIYAIRHRLGDRLEGWPAIELKVKGLGVFPDASRPRVLWAGLDAEGAEAVRQLAQAVEETLDELGFPREKRPFHAHVTMGRIKEGKASFWAAEHAADFGAARAAEVVLYRSTLSGQGAEYAALARFSLSASHEEEEDFASEATEGDETSAEGPATSAEV